MQVYISFHDGLLSDKDSGAEKAVTTDTITGIVVSVENWIYYRILFFLK